MFNLVVLASTGENLSEGQPSKSVSFKPQFRRGILFFNVHNGIYTVYLYLSSCGTGSLSCHVQRGHILIMFVLLVQV